MTAPLPVVVLISGRGTNMCVLADQARSGKLPIEIRAVISDRAEAPGLKIGLRISAIDSVPFRPDPALSGPEGLGPGTPEVSPSGGKRREAP